MRPRRSPIDQISEVKNIFFSAEACSNDFDEAQLLEHSKETIVREIIIREATIWLILIVVKNHRFRKVRNFSEISSQMPQRFA